MYSQVPQVSVSCFREELYKLNYSLSNNNSLDIGGSESRRCQTKQTNLASNSKYQVRKNVCVTQLHVSGFTKDLSCGRTLGACVILRLVKRSTEQRLQSY